MEDQEKTFWLTLSLGGGAALAVLGTGLFAFVEGKNTWGTALTLAGIGGILLVWVMSRHGLFARVLGYAVVTGIVLFTWTFLAYGIYDRHVTSSVTGNPPAADTITGNPPIPDTEVRHEPRSKRLLNLLNAETAENLMWAFYELCSDAEAVRIGQHSRDPNSINPAGLPQVDFYRHDDRDAKYYEEQLQEAADGRGRCFVVDHAATLDSSRFSDDGRLLIVARTQHLGDEVTRKLVDGLKVPAQVEVDSTIPGILQIGVGELAK